ncbi:DUF1641 domain-containing protein [Picrophilus oshimae]|uniref:Uncharacterized conserved protein YjgD, DUF1641 family n=1 Tax=Picrophilus torridus (strain ATCC 700027 / DSM 9790 / JCM 10055 / NBRC 100828 / KAW 2/3) TaxID=1122961 RepID=A0A8G2FXD0_PICTO|nr:DUF1641 domain-containing protein [Picrophilus oshimae]SMD31251.1 Uncharacterized conserved protein YjgD, DUF1641 family [Picrophilus oshimae DSM 9789]
MAKPINYNVEKTNEEINNIKDLMETIRSLDESGILDLIKGISNNYKYIFDVISDQLNKPGSKNMAANIANIIYVLANIDSERLFNAARSITEIFNSMNDERYGIAELIHLINTDPDAGRAVAIILKMLSGFFK